MTANLEGLNTLKDMPVTAPETENKTALVIAAHPDDADFGAAGTSYLWSKEGWTFYYLVCTDGSKGTADRAWSPPSSSASAARSNGRPRDAPARRTSSFSTTSTVN